MDYPCNCVDMHWMIDNNKVFEENDGGWVLGWIELDKTKSGINLERFGVKFNYCLFCGKRLRKKNSRRI